jgi:hypothetical protein
VVRDRRRRWHLLGRFNYDTIANVSLAENQLTLMSWSGSSGPTCPSRVGPTSAL